MEKIDCIFCKIVKKKIPATVIYEDEDVLAFLDIAPQNIGHSLVIPKEHYTDIHDTPNKLMGKIMESVKKVSTAIKTAVSANGINIMMNNEKAAFQVVFHTHIHVIPRFMNDGLEEWKNKKAYKEGEKKEVAKKIISSIP